MFVQFTPVVQYSYEAVEIKMQTNHSCKRIIISIAYAKIIKAGVTCELRRKSVHGTTHCSRCSHHFLSKLSPLTHR
eukprot:COSAG02_NODE_2145_length_9672_cov_1198.924266_4_plen_76_part_00